MKRISRAVIVMLLSIVMVGVSTTTYIKAAENNVKLKWSAVRNADELEVRIGMGTNQVPLSVLGLSINYDKNSLKAAEDSSKWLNNDLGMTDSAIVDGERINISFINASDTGYNLPGDFFSVKFRVIGQPDENALSLAFREAAPVDYKNPYAGLSLEGTESVKSALRQQNKDKSDKDSSDDNGGSKDSETNKSSGESKSQPKENNNIGNKDTSNIEASPTPTPVTSSNSEVAKVDKSYKTGIFPIEYILLSSACIFGIIVICCVRAIIIVSKNERRLYGNTFRD